MTTTTRRRRLTDETIKRLKPPPKPQQTVYWDAVVPSLGLFVSYGGAKTWRCLVYEKGGKPKTIKLDRFPRLKVKQAREQARTILDDPDAALSRLAVGTFEQVAEQWFAGSVKPRGLRSEPEIYRHLERYAYPVWRNRPFLEVRRREINDLLDSIGGARQADAVLGTLSQLMGWYEGRDEYYRSPIVKAMRRGTTVKRQRWLTDDEIRSLWEATEDATTSSALVRLLLLSGQRRGTVAGMRWADLDLTWDGDHLVAGTWTIAREDRMKGAPGVIGLTPQMLRVLENRPKIEGCDFVFPGDRGVGEFTTFSAAKRNLDRRLPEDMDNWRLHDLRRSCRAILSRTGITPDVAEMAIGHKLAGIRSVYDDAREYQSQIDLAFVKVDAEITRIVTGESATVIALPGKR